VHFFRPGDVRLADPLTGETPAAAPAPRDLTAPPPRPRHHAAAWQTTRDLEAAAGVLGVTPRDYVRPELAERRARGLPVARDLRGAAN
jgi:hypothetical protein